MPNPVTWITNVGKSIGYSMMDQIKEANPTIISIKEDNKELFSSVKSLTKFKSMKDIGSSLEDNRYFKLAKDSIDNLKEDLRTGKLYNKERETAAMDKAASEWMGFDDSDFGFGDGNFEFDDMDISSSIEESTMSTNDMMDIVGEKTSKAISSTVIGSSEYIVKSGRKNTQALFKQNNILFSRLHNDMNTINANIGSILDFNKEATTTHYNNSATFFTNMTSKMDETNSLLKELVDMQKEVYGKKDKPYRFGSSGNKFSDIEGSGGLPNFGAWLDLIKKNIKDNSIFSMVDMGMDMGLGATLSSAPSKIITDSIAKVLIPKTLSETMKQFNESLSNIFPNMMLKILENSGDFGLKGFISEIFGVDNTLKTSLDVSGYKKDAVPFDGITRKAITEVIPTYLSKILQAMTNGKETRYNYRTGKFVTLEDIDREYREITSDNARYAFSDVDSLLREYAGKIKFDKDDTGNFITKEQFAKNLQEFYEAQYKASKVFNERKEKKIDASTYGLSGGSKAEISAKLMTEMWKNLPQSEKIKLAREILSRRDSQTRNLIQMEEEGLSPATALFNNSSKLFGINRNAKVDDAAAAAGKYNSSILNVLVDIRKEVSYIRQYGLSRGINNLKRDNKGVYRTTNISNVENFDNFNPYERPEIKEERSYYGYISDYSTLDKNDNEEIEDYGTRAMSEYRQEKAQEKRADRKKGPLEAFFSIFGQRGSDAGKNIDTVIRTPMSFLTKVIHKADQAVYSLVFGREEGNGEERKGILQRIGDNIKDLFDTAKVWLNEHVFQPLKEKFTKEKIKNVTKKFFGFFGIDIEQVGKDIRKFLFGEKDENKNRTKNGLFGGFIDGVKKTFKDIFGWVKGSAKDAYENKDVGLKYAIGGTLNENGKAKQEEINKDKKKAAKDRADISDIIDGLNVKKNKVLQKAKERIEKEKEEKVKEEDRKVNGSLAVGIKRVPKTGVYALSEGEAVIPPDYNPANIRKRYSNEQKAINRFKKHGGINMLASGTDPDVELTEEEKKELEAIEKEQNDWKSELDKIKLNRSDYEESNPSFKYRFIDQFAKFGQFIKGFFGDVMDKSGNIDKDKIKTNVTEIMDGVLGDAKEHFPEMATGGIIGAGTSFITGMIGGPIVGAAVGAGVGLLVKSKNFQNTLFGKEVADKEGNTTREGGILPKSISNFILKYGNTIGKGAALGGILGTVAKLLPVIPGGPITGILVGSTLGYTIKSDKIHNYLFGEEGKLKGLPEKLKSLLPKMGVGAAVGVLANPIIPGGILTNMVLGSAIGFVTDTEQFKDAFWGEKNKDGKRTGGIYEKIVHSITNPVKDFLKENVEYFSDWFRDTIKRNISDFFKPLKKAVSDIGKNVINIFKNMGNKFTESLKENIFNKFFMMLEKTLGISGGIFKFVRNAVTKTIGIPFNIVGGVGRKWQARQIRKGKATYMKTAQERLDFRKNNKVSKLFKNDRSIELDKNLNKMNADELDLALRSVQALKDGGKSAQKEFMDTKNKLSVDISRSNLDRKNKNDLIKLLNSDNINGIRSYLKNANINSKDIVYINDLLDKSEFTLKNAHKVKTEFESGIGRSRLEESLKKAGIDTKKLKNLDNIEEYLINEKENRINKEDENKKELETKAWREDIRSTLEKSLDALLSINNRLDPNYNFPDKLDSKPYNIGQQSDFARRENHNKRKFDEKGNVKNIDDENKRLKNAAEMDNQIFKVQSDKINEKIIKKNKKNIKEEQRKLHPDEYMPLYKRLLFYAGSGVGLLKSGYKEFVDELNGYNDEEYEDISKFKKLNNILGSYINIRKPKNYILNAKNEEIDKDSNSTEKNIIDKFKSYILGNKSQKYETSYYNGIAIRNKVDENGNVEADMSDSETVKALKERDDDRKTQKGILNSITNLPSKIGEFFGIGKNKDEEPKENLLGKILKWTGMGMLALMVAPKVAEFVKNTVVPVVKETVIPAIIKVGTDFKDGIMEGFFGGSDHEGGLANKIGEKIGEGAKWVVDEGVPNLVKTLEKLLASALPWVAEQFVVNIPSIIGGIFSGFGKLSSILTNAFLGKKNTENPETAFKSINDGKLTVGKIGNVSGSSSYIPSSSWQIKGNYTLGISTSSNTNSGGNTTQNISSKLTDDIIDSKTKTYDESGKLEGPKAFRLAAENRVNKYKDPINKIFDNKVEVTTDGKTEYMSVYDLLNSDKYIDVSAYTDGNGNTITEPIKGSELLNYPEIAEKVLKINTSLTPEEQKENAKKYDYDHGEGLLDPTAKNFGSRLAQMTLTGLLTGNNGGATLLKKRASVQAAKASKSILTGNVISAGYHKAKSTIYKTASILPNVGTKINDSIVKSAGEAAANVANKSIKAKVKEFAKICKDKIINLFKDSKFINEIKSRLGKNTDKVIEKLGKESAEKVSEQIVKDTTEEVAEKAISAGTSLMRKCLKVFDAVGSFVTGFNNESGNIAHLLQEQCTTPIRILTGISNTISALLGRFFASDTIFAIISFLVNLISEEDFLNLDELRQEADRQLKKEKLQKGIQDSDYDYEDHNAEYNTNYSEYNMAAWEAQSLGLTGEEAIKHIKSNVSENNFTAQTELDKDKKKLDEAKNKWWELYNSKDNTIKDKNQFAQFHNFQGYDEDRGFYGGLNGLETGPDPGKLSSGTPYVPNSGLYALSKGELVIPKLAEGTNPFRLFSNAIGNIKSIFSSSKLEDNIKNIYKYANSGDDKFFKEDTLSTDPTSKTINAIAKKLFTPVYAVEKMQNYFVKSLDDELGNGDKVLELFNTQLADTNKYLTGDLSMKNYWNDKLDDNKSIYGNMAKVITNIYKSLQFPMILAKSLFQMTAGRSSNDSGNIDAISTQNSTANVSASSISADLSSISTEGTASTINNKSSSTVNNIKNIMNKLDLTGKIAEGSSGNQYKHLVVKYGEKNVIPFKNRNNKVIGYQIKLKNGKTKYIAASKNTSTTKYSRGKKYSSILHNIPNTISGYTASGSGLFVGSGTEYTPIPIESPANSVSDMHYKYSKLPKVRSLSSINKLDYSTENITSTGDNFVSQVDSNISNIRFKTKRDTIRQTVATSGCAPAAATMIINSLRGKDIISMNTATKDAIPYKVPNGGVTSKYFDDEFDKYGIGTDYLENNSDDPNKNNIIRAIRERRPTILLGQDPSNRNKSNSPFGPNPHYVVADSISKDGKYIFINDPESKKPRTKYLLKSILPNIRVGISTFLGKGGKKLGKLYIGSAKTQVKAPAGDYIGKNTKRFESGNKGPRATGSCGNDGGGSYGSYQMIYSGSAKSFWAEHFAAKYGNPSSPSDLNSKWLKAVDDIGESAFFTKEWGYILDNYYKPAVAGIKKIGFDPDNYSRAMQDCIWSWAVHRGASECIREFKYVIAEIKDPMNADETTLINKCYDVRGQKMTGQWSSIATGRYGTGSDSERVVMLSLVGQPPIDYTAPDGVLFTGSKSGTDSSIETKNNTGDGEYKSILDILFAPFDILAASHKLTGSNNNTTTSAGTTEYNADGISGPVSSDPSIAQKQVQVVAKMKSVYGKLKYAQNNAKYPGSRNPDDGSGDCSSTVQWAYQKTLGVDVGGWSGGQADSSNTYLVDGGHGSGGKTDESKLQLGDIMIYGPNNHAEMYFGHGKVLTHGNPNALGPVVADINRRDDYWGTKRLNQFRSNGTANYDSSNSNYIASGSGLVGRGSFVSQLDPRYANRRFNRNGDTINQTIGDSGCAPAAATMVLNDITGRASMLDSSRLALQYKDTNDGVSADYFRDIYSRHGLNTNYYNRKEQVASDLYNGKDVVLLGSDIKNKSKSNSPFGPNPHYVVASGISKDGRSITIKDPEGKRPKKYSTNKILNNTKLGIGYGSGLLNKVLKNYKGRGFGSFSGILYVGDSIVDGMRNCINESGVYFICKASAGLKWLRTTAYSQISDKINSDPNLAIIFNLGVNDLYNKDNYINTYKEIKDAYPNVKFFFMSVNPVDNRQYATDVEVVQFNNIMKDYWSNDYLDVYSYLKSDGYKTVDGIRYDNATSKKIHNKCKEMINGVVSNNSKLTNGNTTDNSNESIIDRILGSMDNLAVKYGLMRKVGNTDSETNGTTTIGGPGSEFPKYTLSDSAINDIATGVTGETGGNSMFTSMQEASQMANLNEVTRKRSADESGIITTIHDGWYSSNSWTRGVTDIAKEAVKKVFVEGKRTLPRYVTEHDTFPLDITNAKNRSEYKFGDPVSNRYGSNYKFYDFFGENKDGDISGYFQSDYEKYKNDQPWSGSGSRLINTPKYEYKQKYSGRSSRLNNISDVFDTFTNTIESSIPINTNNSNSGTISNSDKDLVAMMKTIIKLLAKVADNTNDISDIISILSKLVDLQSTVQKTGEIKSNINDLKRQLTSKLNSSNKANIGSGDLYNLMSNIESLATE